MNERRLKELLAEAPLPEVHETERRAWEVVRAAYETEKDELPRERRWPTRPLLALAAVLALIAAAISAPGDAVTTWLRDAIEQGDDADVGRPGLVSLPAAGRLLVTSGAGAWVVHADGSKRRLGAYDDATWSPHGLFVAATRGRQLVAVEPDKGKVRWALSRPRRVHHPAWAPSGYRIAYGVGRDLHVVAGDGSPDRLLARSVVPGAWAWRPGDKHVLAYTKGNRVHVVDTDTRKELASMDGGPGIERLAWSADGKRLVMSVRYPLRLLRRTAKPTALSRELPSVVVSGDAFALRGQRLAYAAFEREARRSNIVVARLDTASSRIVFRSAGRFRDVAWSPDGRWLLVTWPSADQWLFLRVPGVRKIIAVSNVSREFDPGGRGPAEFPRVLDWCCAE